jgi:hypothetical protein
MIAFPQVAPRHADLNAKSQARLPTDRRQQMVLLRFRDPQPRFRLWDFLRIRLLRSDFDACEPTIVPPRLQAACPRCGVAMLRTGESAFRCQNRPCANRGKLFSAAPPRGVVKLLFPTDLTAADGRHTGVVLVLDRRYEQTVLARVHRTACQLGEVLGVGVL